MIDQNQLHKIMHKLSAEKISEYLPYIIKETARMNEIERSCYLATMAWESNFLKQWKEPAAPFNWDYDKYRPGVKGSVAHRLGNTVPSDAERYCGHGPGQHTGRNNFGILSGLLGVDLISHPSLLLQPKYGFAAFHEWWIYEGCDRPARKGNFGTVTRIWNGGYSHLKQRTRLYAKACRVLGV